MCEAIFLNSSAVCGRDTWGCTGKEIFFLLVITSQELQAVYENQDFAKCSNRFNSLP